MVIGGEKLTRKERYRIATGKDVELLEELVLREVDPFIKEELAVNLAIPMAYRLKLLEDEHAIVRMKTIKNLSMPREFFEYIAGNDFSGKVRDAAKKILEERFPKTEEKLPQINTPLIVTA